MQAIDFASGAEWSAPLLLPTDKWLSVAGEQGCSPATDPWGSVEAETFSVDDLDGSGWWLRMWRMLRYWVGVARAGRSKSLGCEKKNNKTRLVLDKPAPSW